MGVLAAGLVACGGDSGPGEFDPMPDDAGFADTGPPPDRFPPPVMSDAAVEPDGTPPPELAGASCAIDTNKLYELVRRSELPDTSELAVDSLSSRFGVAFLGKGSICLDALFVAEVQGPLSQPEVLTAVDECSTIEQPSIGENEGTWLLAFVDNRSGARNVWVQAFDPRAESQSPAYQITDNTRAKRDVKIIGLGPDGALVAWVETDPAVAGNQFMPQELLKVRPLWPDGEPFAEEVVIGEGLRSDTERTAYGSVRLSRLGAANAALGYRLQYRRFAGSGCFTDGDCTLEDLCVCDPDEPNPPGYCYCKPIPCETHADCDSGDECPAGCDTPSPPNPCVCKPSTPGQAACELTGHCEAIDGTPRLDVTVEERNELVLEVLDLDGNPLKAPLTLTDEAGTSGTLDIAADEEGGAVIYSIAQGLYGRQIWFQAIDENGEPPPMLVGVTPVGSIGPMLVVAPPTRAFDASVAKLASSFAILYRALPPEDVDPADGVPDYENDTDSPRLHILFTDRFGRDEVPLEFGGAITNESDVALTEPTGGLTSIRSGYDGRVVVAWRDLHEDGTTSLTAARLPCIGGR